MAETQKRLKKNISFSAHEKDIYDYLEKQGNASAFIKRLILNQMMIDRGIVSPTVIKVGVEEKEGNVQCETSNEDNQQTEKQNTEEVTTVNSNEPEESNEELTVETSFTEEDLKTIQVLPDL